MAHGWETSASVWLEDEESGQFELASSKGLSRIDWQGRARTRLPDVAQLLGASLPLRCQCAPIFPEGFAFCPNCGQALASMEPASPRAPDWWGPCSDPALPKHVPHGMPVTTLPLASSIERRPAAPAVGTSERAIARPPNAHVVFAAARFGFSCQRLIALAYARNVLQYWDPNALAWHVMVGEPHAADLSFTASDYAWLPASGTAHARGEVALVPTAHGLVRLFLNPISETYHTETVLEAAIASAPGTVLNRIACLVHTGSGTRLWSAKPDASEPRFLDCDGADVPASGWSRPISYDNKLMWLHARGHLIWQPGSASGHWIAWPAGWTPRLTFGGPTQSRDGRLWLIGHDGQAYCFLELGAERGQIERIDGARLGFASLLFRRGHAVANEPWDSESVEDPNEGNSWVLPLLRDFNNNASHPCGLVLRFSGADKAEVALAASNIEVSVEWRGRRDVILARIPRLSRPLDCVPFVYDDCLWLHHPGLDNILGWRLKELA